MIPSLSFEFSSDEIEQKLEFAASRVDNLKEPLRLWARDVRKDAQRRIAAGEGMPPLAASTLAKRESQLAQTARFTAGGKERASYARQLEKREKRLAGLKRWADNRFLGAGKLLGNRRVEEKLRKHEELLQAHRRTLQLHQEAHLLARDIEKTASAAQGGRHRMSGEDREVLRRAVSDVARAQKSKNTKMLATRQKALAEITASLRDKYLGIQGPATPGGGAVASRVTSQRLKRINKARARMKARPLLGRLPGTLTTIVETKGHDWLAGVWSRWGKASMAHNEGAAVGNGTQLPKREYLVLTEEMVADARRRLISWGLQPLQEGT